MVKISVVINTLNAERLLETCLKSVKSADEILICDMYSDDRTIEIAKKYKCKIVYHEKTGIVEPARNWAISQSSGDWVLILDADEVVTPELWKALREYANNPKKNHNSCFIVRETVLMGKTLKSWRQSKCKRFWKKGTCSYSDKIHEMPITHNGQDFHLKGKNIHILHYHIPSINNFIEKTNHYTDFELKRFSAKNKKASISKLLFRPLSEFFKYYFLKGAFREGTHGYIFARLKAHYKFVQWAKLYEKEFVDKNKDLIY